MWRIFKIVITKRQVCQEPNYIFSNFDRKSDSFQNCCEFRNDNFHLYIFLLWFSHLKIEYTTFYFYKSNMSNIQLNIKNWTDAKLIQREIIYVDEFAYSTSQQFYFSNLYLKEISSVSEKHHQMNCELILRRNSSIK